ncbi:MAG: response regulator [Rhodospirillales bacterium]
MIRILCIEDDDAQRDEIVEWLTSNGFEVLEAEDGDSGLKLILEEMPDLILCDRMMKKKSGYTLLEELRQNHPKTKDIPFIFLTALDDRRDKLATARLQPSGYITKPIDIQVLLSEIRKLI